MFTIAHTRMDGLCETFPMNPISLRPAMQHPKSPTVDHPTSFARPTAYAVTVLLSLALVGCGGGSDKKPQAGAPGAGMPAPEVSVVKVQAANQPIRMEYVGQTAGSREIEVRARVGGILEKRLFQEGSVVQAGKPLFQIDTATLKNQVNLAQAAVAVAQAKLNQTQRDVARLGPLAAAKAISQKEFDDSKSALESAQAALQQTQAQAQDARLKLSYATVTAPITGITSAASVSEGSLIAAGESLLTTIVQTDPIYVNFSVSESDWLRMKQQISAGQLQVPASAGKQAQDTSLNQSGLAVQLTLADGSVHPVQGKLNFSGERINMQTGNFDMRAQIANPDGNLRAGQFVRVQLLGAERPQALAIPQRAVIDSPVGKIVFVVTADNKLQPHPVELGSWSQGQWIVNKGLQDGDTVVVDGFIKAHDPGMTVTPVPYKPTPAPGQAPGQGAAAAHGGNAPQASSTTPASAAADHPAPSTPAQPDKKPSQP